MMENFFCKNFSVLRSIYRVVDSDLRETSTTLQLDKLTWRRSRTGLNFLKIVLDLTGESKVTSIQRRTKMLLEVLNSVKGWAGHLKKWTRHKYGNPLGAENIANANETSSITKISERTGIESNSHEMCPTAQEQEMQSRDDEEIDKQELIEAITHFAVATDDAQSILRYLVVVEVDC